MKNIMIGTLIFVTATLLMMPVVNGCRSEMMSTGSQPRQDADATVSSSEKSENEFHWRGSIARNEAIEIKGLNGNVRAFPSTGTEVEVSATKRGRHSNPAEVQMKVLEHPGGVTICAIYPSSNPVQPNRCEPGDAPMNVNNNDVEVDFEVRVPAAVRFIGRTVNGEVGATSLRNDVEGYSSQGNVNLSTTGLARARTSNGSISASFKSTSWTTPLVFETSNGNITLGMPSEVNAQVQAQTQTGNINTDFPLNVAQPNPPAKSIDGTIGSGAQLLIVKTKSGNIDLKRVR